MAAIGWATQAGLPVFGLVAISGHRRTRLSRRLLWTAAALVGIPGLVFLPARHDRWVDLAFYGSGGFRAFGTGLLAAWLALVSLVPALILVLWLEDKAYLRGRRHPPATPAAEPSRSIRIATQVIIGYAAGAALVALAVAEALVAK